MDLATQGAIAGEQMADTRPVLVVSRADAKNRLQAQIEKGCELAESPVTEEPGGSSKIRQAEVDKWHAYNGELLSRLFNNGEIREEYEGANVEAVRRTGRYGKALEFNFRAARLSRHVRNYVTALEAVLERLDLIPDSTESAVTGSASITGPTDRTRVFIVHGHDEAMKEAVARYVSQHLKLTPVILHEQPNKGRTIIDKFESAASGVGFALVLFSADDFCGALGDEGSGLKKPRPRQNVVFELGFFVGKLGRQSVAVLYHEGVEMPSDYQGVVYIPFDTAGAWRLIVAREMASVGLPVDVNGLLTSG